MRHLPQGIGFRAALGYNIREPGRKGASMPKILIVEDDADLCALMQTVLVNRGYNDGYRAGWRRRAQTSGSNAYRPLSFRTS